MCPAGRANSVMSLSNTASIPAFDKLSNDEGGAG
jgi:hypothetical protein